jgi:PAS domain S-box-containing protein
VPAGGEGLTLVMISTLPRDIPAADPAEPDSELLRVRSRIGLWAVLAAIAAYTLADVELGRGLHPTLVVRLVQFVLIGIAAVASRSRLRWRTNLAVTTGFICLLYVTSAVAGSLRGSPSTQPITDLAIAFTTAMTLPWGPWPQLVSVLVAMLSIAGSFYAVNGSLAGTSPHMATGFGIAFLVSVYIAHQLRRYRRERDAAEAALRQSEERFRSLIERGSDVITIVDAGGIIRYESPSIARILGYRPEEAVGEPARRFVHPEDLATVTAAFRRAIGGETTSAECRFVRPDGSRCDVEATFTDLLAHPAVRGIVVNWRDISDRKRAEEERARYIRELADARDQALASTRAKSMFLANVSHEIRTPMNVIIGMTDMVLDSPLNAEQRGDLGRVRVAAIGLLAIINDILDASKIEAGKMTIEVVDMDLRATIEAVVDLLAPAAAGKGLSIVCAIPPDLPSRLKGDPVRLRQTLVNLVANAVKFTDAGTITLAATLLRRVHSHVVLRLSVHDTGVGIPRERQAAIFESFAQGDDSTTRVYGGTGLGLAICRQLVALMGGRMGLESEPEQGSTFWLELTMECGTASAAAA